MRSWRLAFIVQFLATTAWRTFQRAAVNFSSLFPCTEDRRLTTGDSTINRAPRCASTLRTLKLASLLCAAVWSLSAQNAPVKPASAQAKPGTVDFNGQIKPILATNCSMCHGQEKRSGGLSLASYSDVLEGGRSGTAI